MFLSNFSINIVFIFNLLIIILVSRHTNVYTLIHFRATEIRKILLSQFQKTAFC